MNLIIEQTRQSVIYGVRPARSFRSACEKFIDENAHLLSLRDIAARLEFVCGFVGEINISDVHIGSLQPVIAALKKRGIKNRSINAYLQDVRRVLNQAAGEWIDEFGLTWLLQAPKIKLFPQNDARRATPISYDEQTNLLAELPGHLSAMVLFALHTGAREAEIANLDWSWFRPDYSLFFVPAEKTKMKRERVIVCNSVALSVCGRPKSQGAVFTYNGKKVERINNSAWKKGRVRAGVECRVHDLRHTFAARLRSAGVPMYTIRDLLGHASDTITAHYSSAQLAELKNAVELLVSARPDVLLKRIK